MNHHMIHHIIHHSQHDSPQDSPQYYKIHHKITRFTTRFLNIGRKILFIYNFVIEFTTRPQENLVVGVGFGIFSFSEQDHKIHHKIFQYRKKNICYIYFYNTIHHKTTRKSCGGGGVWNIFMFTTRPQDSPREFRNLGRKTLFIYNFVIEFTTRPQENLVVGVGFGIFSFSPQDHKIHHESFKSRKKNTFHI
jgi:hypothetical protein